MEPAGESGSLDELVRGLQAMRAAAGQPSYAEIGRRVGQVRAARGVPEAAQRPPKTTVYNCFQPGRRRLDRELVLDIVRALGGDGVDLRRWTDGLRAVGRRRETAGWATVRNELPDVTGTFVGREAQRRLILDGSAPARRFALTGLPGLGKTRLAIHVAAELRRTGRCEHVLVADLRGFDANQPPADPGAVLERSLRLLGLDATEIPGPLSARSRLLAERIHGGRYVVLLDNAADAGQIRPLLVGAADSIVLVTSRLRLDDGPGMVSVPLDPLSTQEAMVLLADTLGPDRIGSEPEAAAALADATGGIPLTVSLAATRAAARPEWTLADHHAALVERQRHLRLDDGLRLGLEASYDALPPESRTLLRLWAGQPCATLDAPALAALAGLDPGAASSRISELHHHHLVVVPRPGRYGLHDAVRAFALDRSISEDRPADRERATGRLRDHFATVAWSAFRARYPGETGRRRVPVGQATMGLEGATARAWVQDNLDAVLDLIATSGVGDLPVHLSAALGPWMEPLGTNREAEILHRRAIEVAELMADSSGAAVARLELGQTLVRLGRPDQADDLLLGALAVFEADGALREAASAANSLAILASRRGDVEVAIEGFDKVLQLARQVGDEHNEMNALNNSANSLRRANRLAEALARHQEAIGVAEQIGDREMLSSLLTNIAEEHHLLGQDAEAIDTAQRGIAIADELGYWVAGYGRDTLGTVLWAQGRRDEAVAVYLRALEQSRTLGDQHLESGVLASLGRAELELGELDRARERLEASVRIAGDEFVRGLALDGLGSVCAAVGDGSGARAHWTEALAILDRIGAAEAEQVRRRLTRP